MLILQQLVNGLMLGGVYVMVAVAFTLIIGMLNFLNFTSFKLNELSHNYLILFRLSGLLCGFDANYSQQLTQITESLVNFL